MNEKFPASEIPSFNLNGSRLPFFFPRCISRKNSNQKCGTHRRSFRDELNSPHFGPIVGFELEGADQ